MFGDWGDEEAAGGWDKHILYVRYECSGACMECNTTGYPRH